LISEIILWSSPSARELFICLSGDLYRRALRRPRGVQAARSADDIARYLALAEREMNKKPPVAVADLPHTLRYHALKKGAPSAGPTDRCKAKLGLVMRRAQSNTTRPAGLRR
jgi:hypothetical protein